MKKTLLIALAAIATIFTSCSSDIINDDDDSNNGQGKGMTLIANVEQDDTRATLTTSDDTSGKWSFAYTDNDKVSVGNDKIDNYYTFTKNGETFSCADALATKQETNWYAYYPGTDINLTNQDGTEASAAKLYALAGTTETATTGADGLTINMKAKAAVLRIVKVDNYGPCNIYLKTKNGFVKGLKAKKNEAGFEVETSNTEVSVFKKASEGNAGIYYVIVPAEVYLEVWNEGIKFKTTSKGLTAGKYYTLTSGPTTGTATATINGETKKIGWVQMWIGGPRFATENVADEMTWFEAIKKGDKYVWGAKWHTASVDEVKSMYNNNSMLNTEILKSTYEYKDKHGYTLTGKQPGYTNNTIFIIGDNTSYEGYINGKFWLSDELTKGYGTTFNFYGDANNLVIHPYTTEPNFSTHPVRPVLTIDTVLWGEQDIK